LDLAEFYRASVPEQALNLPMHGKKQIEKLFHSQKTSCFRGNTAADLRGLHGLDWSLIAF
jgi:hypothetical protein